LKKEIVCRLLYLLSALLILGFAISFGVDTYKYYTTVTGSAPLYAYALVRSVEFILPGVIVFALALTLKKKK